MSFSIRERASVRFSDRSEAGRLLARELAPLSSSRPVVVALPRGGVPVAFEVARALDAELDLCIVRKVASPLAPELALGAVAEDGYTYLNHDLIRRSNLSRAEREQLVEAKRREVEQRSEKLRAGRERIRLRGRNVIVVDDGIATGATVRAALRAVRAQSPSSLVLAVPVAAPDSLQELRTEADRIVCLLTPSDLRAVGLWYVDFSQVSDSEVVRLLGLSRGFGASR